MSAQIERRFVAPGASALRSASGSRRIRGYFAVFNRWSPVYNGFRERIAPTFFDEALAMRDDVMALYNHDMSLMLGRSTAGTLRLKTDSTGLYGEIDPVPESPTGDEVLANLRLGNLTGASFGFTMREKGGESWTKASDGVWERTMLKPTRLYDVSVVASPFYPQTSVSAYSVKPPDQSERNDSNDDGWLWAARERLRLLELQYGGRH